MSFVDAAILGLVQGLTEFIPVSSSGHLILIRDLFGIHGGDLSVDAVLQLATGLAILVYFAKELPRLARERKMVLAIIIGTVPAVIFGLLLESRMETIFRSAGIVAWMLIAGALLMYLADRFAKENRGITLMRAGAVGVFQVLALVPGISRSGATISGGLLSGLTRETATRFSFLLALPLILGSGVEKLGELSLNGTLSSFGAPLLFGSLVAFVSGFWSIHFLLGYLKNHRFTVFIWYRLALALLLLVFV